MARTKKRNGNSVSSASSEEDVVIPLQPTAFHKMAPAKIYNMLNDYKLDYHHLMANGYPLWDPVSETVTFYSTNRYQKDWVHQNDLTRTCSRCNIQFVLNEDRTVKPEPCTYHHKAKTDPVTLQKRLTCCYQTPGTSSKGCLTENNHVFSSTWSSTLRHFKRTPKPGGPQDFRSHKVYAMDCELVHTLNGMEVARVSLVDVKGRVILDHFVMPAYPVISYNTKFSGVTERDMENAISLETCRLYLFQHINSETLLVGHSLESDLKALRLIHYNIIDTSVLFIDESGKYPIKLSLQTLAWNYLGKIIQNSDDGHSSIEDSKACLDILQEAFFNKMFL